MNMTAKQQALLDMSASGISISVLTYERAIIEITKTEDSVRIDFRAFNGGHNKKTQNKQ